jgi:ferredoxin-NADP reductase
VRYTAGQFIELTIPHDNPDERGQKHWFTLSSSPTEPLPTITTKFPSEGPTSTFKQALQNLKPGDAVSMSDPMGDFVLPKDKTIPLVFVAGGIGVTPMRSMIKWLHDSQETRPITLIYAVADKKQLAFQPVFDEAGIEPVFLYERLTPEKILELAPDQPGQLYFISGPEPMVEALVEGLTKSGISESRLVGDYFPNYSPQL